MDKEEFLQQLNEKPEYREDLFIRGFLLTDHTLENMENFPFYGKWKEKPWGVYSLLTSADGDIYPYFPNQNFFPCRTCI